MFDGFNIGLIGYATARLSRSVDIRLSPTKQVDFIATRSRIDRCNRVFSVLSGEASPSRMIGRSWDPYRTPATDEVLHRFVEGRYRFANSMPVPGGSRGDSRMRLWLDGRVQKKRLAEIVAFVILETSEDGSERQEALRRERTRLLQDLHDGAGQLVTSIRMIAEEFVDRLDSDGARAEERDLANTMLRYAREVQDTISTLNRGGYSPLDDYSGVVDRLELLRRTISELPGVNATFVADRIPEVAAHAARELEMIAREAVNNALRHGHARNIRIELRKKKGELVLWIEDDGTGRSSSEARKDRSGLDNMNDRARRLGGELDVEFDSAEGTTVECKLPVDQACAA